MKKLICYIVAIALLCCGCSVKKLNDGASYEMIEAGNKVLDAWDRLNTDPNRNVTAVKKQFYQQIYDAVEKAEEICDEKNEKDKRILQDLKVIKAYVLYLDIYGEKPQTTTDIEVIIDYLKEHMEK